MARERSTKYGAGHRGRDLEGHQRLGDMAAQTVLIDDGAPAATEAPIA